MTRPSYDTSYPPSLWQGPPVVPATGATAGIPGTWTPAGSTPPADVASMAGIVATPSTPWTTGQFVQTATAGVAGRTTWTGSAWVGGVAPGARTKAPPPEPEPEPAPAEETPTS